MITWDDNIICTEPAWTVECAEVVPRDAMLEQNLKIPVPLKEANFEVHYFLLERNA